MEEKFVVEKIEEYKLNCEENLRKEGIFKQKNILKEMKEEGKTLGGIIIAYLLVFIIGYLLEKLGSIGKMLSIPFYFFSSIFMIGIIVGIISVIFYVPIKGIYENNKHVRMGKKELEEELEREIEKQKIFYGQIAEIYKETLNMSESISDEKKRESFLKELNEKELFKKIVAGKKVSNFEIKSYLFFRKIDLFLA